MKKRILSFVLAIVLIFVFIPTAFATSNPWSAGDAPSSWAQSYIREAHSQNLVPSSLLSRFGDSITRAEFTHLAVALYETVTGTEITGRVTFTDTDDVNVQKMAYLGVVRGVGGGRFNPDGLLSRQEAAAMLSRLIGVIETPMRNHPATFADGDSISSWAVDYIGQMRLFGIMGGVGGNRFDPNGRYTIEQSITTMLRVFQMESVAEINDFFCGVNLDVFRNGFVLPGISSFPGFGVDFSIGEVVDVWSTPNSITTARGTNFADPHLVDVDSASHLAVGNSNTQTGDVTIERIITFRPDNPNSRGRQLTISIDIGNTLEVWRARGYYHWLETVHLRPDINENTRSYFRAFYLVTGECTCP